MTLEAIQRNSEKFLLMAMLALWSLAWDYNHFGSYQRGGRIKVMVITAAALAAWRIARTWHWSVGAAYLYLIGSWLHFSFSPWVLPVEGKHFIFQPDGLDEVVGVTAVLFLLPVLAARIPRRLFEDSVIGAGVVHAAIGVANLHGVYFGFSAKKVQEDLPIGLLGQQTLLGPFLAYAAALCALRVLGEGAWWRRGLYALPGAFLLVLAVFTKSSMTYGSIAAAGAVILLFHLGARGALLALALAAAGLGLADYFDRNVFWHSGRLEPWRDAYSLYLLRPWFGFGIGSWGSIAEVIKEVRHYQNTWDYLHSEPLQALFELGRVGAGLLALIAARVLGRIHFAWLFREREALTWIVGIAVFGTNSLANFTLHLVPHGPIFALCCYMLLTRRE